jgi:hypothetical protein
MFEDKVFYHGITRKAIVSFGVMFNNINIRRRDASGEISQTVRVPLSYGPKNKMLARIQRLPVAEESKTEITVPRLSFEVVNFEYDPARKINLQNQLKTVISQTQAKRTYGPVPYNITMNLYAYVKNQDDGLQIFEQIVPAFNPDFNVTVNYVPEMGIKHDLPIIINNVSYDDNYEGDTAAQRMIIWTYTFTLKVYYYGPTETQEVIREAIANVFNDPNLSNQINKYSVTTDPNTVAPTDQYKFLETFEE